MAWVCLTVVPFLGKPFHIDDDIYLKGAEQVLRDPLRPLGGAQNMLGTVMPTYHFTQHPPLVSYYMALVRVLGGHWSEVRLHTAFLVFPMLAALGMYSLAQRFSPHPLAATLLLLATPAFVVMAHSVMTDVPFLALSLAATASFVRGVDLHARRPLVLSGAFLAAACMVQYRGLLLVPLLFVYAWLQRKMLTQSLLALLPPLGLMGAWSVWNIHDIGVLHIADAGGWMGFSVARILRDALAYVTLVGGATLCPFFALWLTRRSLARPWIWAALIPSAGLLAVRWAPDHVGIQRALLLFFFAAGFAMLWSLLPSPGRARELLAAARKPTGDRQVRDELFLLLMVAIPLASQVFLNLFASARSLLIALPFLILLWVRRMETQSVTGRERVAQALGVGVALTVTCALLVAVADDQYARAERDLARGLRHRPWASAPVWFSGEWGFRHYMEAEGYRYMTSDGAGVADGDILVMPDIPCPAGLDPQFVARLRLVDVIESGRRFPLRTMSFEAHAGFYSDFHGLLPYSLSRAPLDRIRAFTVGSTP
jgi:4-amino-4-deoxy-L-arabinose transferase-like glycosyltransferase